MTRRDRVAEFMSTLSRLDGGPTELPDPRLIVRRAQLMARLAEEDRVVARATRPVLIAGVAGPFLLAVLLSTLGARSPGAAVLLLAVLAAAAAVPMVLASD